MKVAKPFEISKKQVWQAYQEVKSKGGAAGVDGQSLENYERDLKNNLYRLWNRLSSGSYFPPAVKAVPIPKKSGGTRVLGVPTVSDIAQTVVEFWNRSWNRFSIRTLLVTDWVSQPMTRLLPPANGAGSMTGWWSLISVLYSTISTTAC